MSAPRLEFDRAVSIALTPYSWERTKLCVVVMCPNKHVNDLIAHTIDGNGDVDPEVNCYARGCGWSSKIKLNGWHR